MVRTSQAFGVTGDTLLPTPSAGLLQLGDQAGSPTGRGLFSVRTAPSLRSSCFRLDSPFPVAQTWQAKLQIFLDRQFCKRLLLLVRKHRNAIFCQMLSRFSF